MSLEIRQIYFAPDETVWNGCLTIITSTFSRIVAKSFPFNNHIIFDISRCHCRTSYYQRVKCHYERRNFTMKLMSCDLLCLFEKISTFVEADIEQVAYEYEKWMYCDLFIFQISFRNCSNNQTVTWYCRILRKIL